MKKKLVGAEAVLAQVNDGVFVLDENMILTPAARDILRENRVMIMAGTIAHNQSTPLAPCGAPVCMNCSECVMENKEVNIEALIRKIVAEQLTGAGHGFEKTVDKESGVLCVKAATVNPEPFDTGKEGDKVFITDVVNLEESPRLGFGIMEMKEGTAFDWTLRYDEVDYIIEGTLDVIIDGRKVTATKGDIIFIPKDSSITFSTPDSTRFMFVTYPADWASQ